MQGVSQRKDAKRGTGCRKKSREGGKIAIGDRQIKVVSRNFVPVLMRISHSRTHNDRQIWEEVDGTDPLRFNLMAIVLLNQHEILRDCLIQFNFFPLFFL